LKGQHARFPKRERERGGDGENRGSYLFAFSEFRYGLYSASVFIIHTQRKGGGIVHLFNLLVIHVILTELKGGTKEAACV
jgi:uncharacterized membrane protein